MLKPVIQLSGKTQEEVEEIIEKHSMKKEYDDWASRYGCMALPAYSTDIMYNLLKRTERDVRNQCSKKMNREEFLAYLAECFGLLEKNLKKQVKIYENDTKDKFPYAKLEEGFKKCPFVKFIMNKEYSGVFTSFVDGFLQAIMGEVHVDEVIEPIDMDG